MAGFQLLAALAVAFAPSGTITLGRVSAGAALTPLAPSSWAPLPEAPLQVRETVARLQSAAVAWSLRNLGTMRSLMPADDVMLALASPEAFWLLREWRMQAFGAQYALKDTLDGTRRQIHTLAAEGHDVLWSSDVSVRPKGLWSTFHKAVVRGKHVSDVLAVRVVLHGSHGEDACYEALEAMRTRWPSVAGRFKDYVRFPKPNGYSGLHDTLLLPSGQPFELQIRTEEQHMLAEFGSAAHKRYKGVPTSLFAVMLAGIASGLPTKSSSSSSSSSPLRHVMAWLALFARLKH